MAIVFSSFTRPLDTITYSLGDLVSSNTTAGSIVVPKVIAPAIGSGVIQNVRLYSHGSPDISGMSDGVSFSVRLWSVAPTYVNGDNGLWALATGYNSLLGKVDVGAWYKFSTIWVGTAIPLLDAYSLSWSALQNVWWDLSLSSGTFTPASGQQFSLAVEFV